MATPRKARVLAIDDEPSMTEWLKTLLEGEGYEVRTALTASRGEDLFKTWRPDVVVTDLMLPDLDGLELLKRFRQTYDSAEVIMLTGHGSVPQAVEAIRAGAYSFVEKPIEPDALVAMLDKAVERRELKTENQQLRQQLSGPFKVASIVGRSTQVVDLLEMVKNVAPSEANILIQGENGTGKELIANALHTLSKRARGPFIKVNCAAIPKDLIESELFGYKKGAFTGAMNDKEGLFEMANGGSLLLDEIGEMPAYLQTKLLRVLQEREYRPIGTDRLVRVDFRLICATNIDIDDGPARRPAARGSVLPHQHDHVQGAGASRPHRGHSAAVRTLPREVPPALPAQRAIDRASGHASVDAAPVAGQRARARERHRARRAHGQGFGDHAGRSSGDRARGGGSGRRVRAAAASDAGRDRKDGHRADAPAHELEQAGGRADSGPLPADALQQDEEARDRGSRPARARAAGARGRGHGDELAGFLPERWEREQTGGSDAVANARPDLGRFSMDDRSRVALFMGLGALAGGLAGYLLVTERGRSVRQGLGPRLQAFIDEAEELAQAFDRTRRAVADGWKTFNQIVDDRQADVREWHRS